MEEGVTIIDLINRAMQDKLFLEIEYANNSYEKSTRVISEINPNNEYGAGYISAYCHMREENRTFKISRIIDARIVKRSAKKAFKQLFNYEFDASKPIFNLYGEIY